MHGGEFNRFLPNDSTSLHHKKFNLDSLQQRSMAKKLGHTSLFLIFDTSREITKIHFGVLSQKNLQELSIKKGPKMS